MFGLQMHNEYGQSSRDPGDRGDGQSVDASFDEAKHAYGVHYREHIVDQ